MKKWLVLALAVGLVVVLWLYVREQRLTPEWNKPKFDTVRRGDIRVPVTAAGLIEPLQRIEVKSKASGEVIELRVNEGKFVTSGQVLVVLKRDDEERSVERAQAELDRTQALLAQAKIAAEEADAGVTIARARHEVAKQEILVSETELERARSNEQRGDATRQEIVTARARHITNIEQEKIAGADVINAALAVSRAKESVRLQEAALRVARKSLEDAEERLRETTIVAPLDAIVSDVNVRVGEVIQGGQTTFTGGTVLLRLADVSVLKVTARVDEADYGRVIKVAPIEALPQMPGMAEAAIADTERMARRGGEVRLTVDAFPEMSFKGHIERVEPQGKLNASIIQFDVHVRIDDPNRFHLPLGTQAQVEFTVESVSNALVIASEAVKTHNDQRGVWVKTDPQPGTDERFGKKFLRCRFGITDGSTTEVLEVLDGTLDVGQQVYTRLPVDVDDES